MLTAAWAVRPDGRCAPRLRTSAFTCRGTPGPATAVGPAEQEAVDSAVLEPAVLELVAPAESMLGVHPVPLQGDPQLT
jgi:hypothetical protein